jgi:hypothetical protein
MAADEIERAMMRASEVIALELLVGLEGEVTIGIKHELDALAQFFVAQEQGIGGGLGFNHEGNEDRGVRAGFLADLP